MKVKTLNQMLNEKWFKDEQKKRKKKADKIVFSEEQKIRVIEYFKANKDNSMTDLAKVFGISYSYASAIIDHYLKQLKVQ